MLGVFFILEMKQINITYQYVNIWACMFDQCTLYIGYTAIGYGAKSVKGWVLGCPDLPTVNLIGYNAKNRLQRGVKSVITWI